MEQYLSQLPMIHNPFGESLPAQPNILILGLGESGMAMARWCLTQGAKVQVHDTRTQESLPEKALQNIEQLNLLGVDCVTFGPELVALDLDQIDIVGVSPGMSPLVSPIKELLELEQQGKFFVWGELEFFSQALEALKNTCQYHPQILAITGTNGKTTTTALTGVICERAEKRVAIAGNISPSLLDKFSTYILTADAFAQLPEYWVLELSSFQLFYSKSFNPTVATVLNITQDHFDWHGDEAHYLASKAKIFGLDTIPVLNRDDSKVMNLLPTERLDKNRTITFGTDAPFEEDSFGIIGDMGLGGFDWLAWAEPSDEEEFSSVKKRRKKGQVEELEPVRIKRLIPADALLIKGRHNAANALAALALAQGAGLSMSPLLHALREYRGEPHRVQSIAIINDVEYIDDSKGTNVGATIAALQGLGIGFEGRKKIILIAGGDGKGQDFSPLRNPIANFAKAVVLIGRDAQLIEDVISGVDIQIIRASNLDEAVIESSKITRSGDIVLLSPACASFDMFKDYAHRAQVFIQAVQELSMNSQMMGESL